MVNMTLQEFVAGFTWPVIICLIVGIVLLIIEMFTPGFGAPGLAGLTALILAVILKAKNFTDGLWMTLIIMAVVGVLLLFFLRSATKGAISKSPLILHDAITEDAGYISTQDMAFFIGKSGKTLTALRPAGMADFDGVRLDVISEGDFIPANTTVCIESIEGRRIIVRQHSEENTL